MFANAPLQTAGPSLKPMCRHALGSAALPEAVKLTVELSKLSTAPLIGGH